MKIKSKLQFPIALAIMSFAIFSMIFQGCEKEEMYDEFLSVNLSNENLTPEQIATINKAQDRIDEYVFIKDGKFNLSISSGKEIAISEELYELFLNKMENSNLMILENQYIIQDKKFVLNAPSLSVTRLKSGSLEYNFGDNEWEVQVDLYWYGVDISIADNYVKAILGGTAVALYWIPDPLVTKVIGTITAITLTTYEMWGGNGVTVHLRPGLNYLSYN